LSTSLDLQTVWRLCSLFTFVIVVAIANRFREAYRQLSREEFKASGGKTLIFYTGSLLGIAATLLQLYNVITLQTFWPFFAAIATLLALAMIQFVLLVTARDEAKS